MNKPRTPWYRMDNASFSSLCTIEIEKNEYGLYEDPYSVVLPF